MTTKSPSSKAIDAVIQHLVTPLNAEGFRKTARTFHRSKGNVIQLVNFQSSMWNMPEQATFTINLNVVLPAFHEKWTGKPLPKNPGSAAPVCAYRIGLLMPEGKDHWWVVTPESDTVSISREVTKLIMTLGLPFLNKASDLNFLLEKYLSEPHFAGITMNKSLAAATLLCCMNREKEARETIRVLRERNKHAGFGETIDIVEARLGLASNKGLHRSR